MCIQICLYIHMYTHSSTALVKDTFTNCLSIVKLLHETLPFRAIQHWCPTMSYNSCKAMWQAYNKHCLLYYKTLVNVKRYFLTRNAILPFGKKKYFKNFSFPLSFKGKYLFCFLTIGASTLCNYLPCC